MQMRRQLFNSLFIAVFVVLSLRLIQLGPALDFNPDCYGAASLARLYIGADKSELRLYDLYTQGVIPALIHMPLVLFNELADITTGDLYILVILSWFTISGILFMTAKIFQYSNSSPLAGVICFVVIASTILNFSDPDFYSPNGEMISYAFFCSLVYAIQMHRNSNPAWTYVCVAMGGLCIEVKPQSLLLVVVTVILYMRPGRTALRVLFGIIAVYIIVNIAIYSGNRETSIFYNLLSIVTQYSDSAKSVVNTVNGDSAWSNIIHDGLIRARLIVAKWRQITPLTFWLMVGSLSIGFWRKSFSPLCYFCCLVVSLYVGHEALFNHYFLYTCFIFTALCGLDPKLYATARSITYKKHGSSLVAMLMPALTLIGLSLLSLLLIVTVSTGMTRGSSLYAYWTGKKMPELIVYGWSPELYGLIGARPSDWGTYESLFKSFNARDSSMFVERLASREKPTYILDTFGYYSGIWNSVEDSKPLKDFVSNSALARVVNTPSEFKKTDVYGRLYIYSP